MSTPLTRKTLLSLTALILLASIASPRHAAASPANWGDGFPLLTVGGPVNPGVLVGFNPQPEPPGTAATLFTLVGGEAKLTIPNISDPPGAKQNFQFLLGVSSTQGTPVITADPGTPFRVAFSIDLGSSAADFTAIVDVMSASGGVVALGSAVAFNPQPEPPGGAVGYGVDFNMTSLSDVTLTLRIEDGAGNLVPLVVAPVPAVPGVSVWGMALLAGLLLATLSYLLSRDATSSS